MLLKRINVGSATEFDNVSWDGYDGVIFENQESQNNTLWITGFVAPDPVTEGITIHVVNRGCGNFLLKSLDSDTVAENQIQTVDGFDRQLDSMGANGHCLLTYDATNNVWTVGG